MPSTRKIPAFARMTPKLKWIFQTFAIPVIVAYLVYYFVSSPALPLIESSVSFNSGALSSDIAGPFSLDYQNDSDPWLKISIENIGDKEANSLEIELATSKYKIEKVSRVYVPGLIKNRVSSVKSQDHSYYEMFDYLPSSSSANYTFSLDKFIKSDSDFSFSVISKSKNWRTVANVFDLFFPAAIASTVKAKENVIVGGYNIAVLSQQLFDLVLDKGFLSGYVSGDDAKAIKSLITGGDFVKFNKDFLASLVKAGAISQAQSDKILATAKKAGGVLIDGYNIVVLEVEILKILLETKKITKDEGQKIIDKAKES